MALGHLGSADSSRSFLLLRSTKSLPVATPSPRLPGGSQPVERCRGQNWYLCPWCGVEIHYSPLCSLSRCFYHHRLLFSFLYILQPPHAQSQPPAVAHGGSLQIAKKIKASLFPLPRVLSRQAGSVVGGIFVRLPVLTLPWHMSHQARMDEGLLTMGVCFHVLCLWSRWWLEQIQGQGVIFQPGARRLPADRF